MCPTMRAAINAQRRSGIEPTSRIVTSKRRESGARRATSLRLGARLICALSLAAAGSAAYAQAPAPDWGADLVIHAVTLVGTPYRYGGSAPRAGFDCSGLVRFVFGETAGLELPRRSEELSRIGTVVQRSDIEPGDLVFFNTRGRPWSHVAIAIGDGRFVHAPARGGRVRIEALSDPYWRARYNGARRLEVLRREPRPAAVVADAGEARELAANMDERISP